MKIQMETELMVLEFHYNKLFMNKCKILLGNCIFILQLEFII